jgi:phosphoglycerol transferase MdoB-like AlkP superfamily enzyme
MHICYYIIQIVFTLVGSIGLFAFMFFNNANLEEVLSDGIVPYLIFKNSFSLVALLLYNAIVTIVSICILWLISKISKKGSVLKSATKPFNVLIACTCPLLLN